MPTEEQLTNEKSLDLIRQMIDAAKQKVTDNGVNWLLWGTMIFLASLSTYFLIIYGYKDIFMGWNIFGFATVILLSFQLLRPKKKAVKTYVDDLLRLIDLGFIICMFTVILSINIAVSPNEGFGYLHMLYAFLMMTQGGILRFTPLKIGAIVNWIGAIAIFINKDFKYDMLISAAAVLIGYIIPGLMLLYRAKSGKEGS